MFWLSETPSGAPYERDLAHFYAVQTYNKFPTKLTNTC